MQTAYDKAKAEIFSTLPAIGELYEYCCMDRHIDYFIVTDVSDGCVWGTKAPSPLERELLFPLASWWALTAVKCLKLCDPITLQPIEG